MIRDNPFMGTLLIAASGLSFKNISTNGKYHIRQQHHQRNLVGVKCLNFEIIPTALVSLRFNSVTKGFQFSCSSNSSPK